MSEGTFSIARYESDESTLYPVRVQPESITTWNPEASGTALGNFYFKATSNRRRYGHYARYVTLSRPVGDVDGPFTSSRVYVTVPVFTKTAFNTLNFGQDVAYRGVNNFEVTTKTPERIR